MLRVAIVHFTRDIGLRYEQAFPASGPPQLRQGGHHLCFAVVRRRIAIKRVQGRHQGRRIEKYTDIL